VRFNILKEEMKPWQMSCKRLIGQYAAVGEVMAEVVVADVVTEAVAEAQKKRTR